MFTRQALIVDDEPLMQRSLHESLKKHDFQVLLAGNGREALELFQKSPAILVITDIKMPQMDGIELLKHIKTISPSTCVVLMSAYGNVERAVEAVKLGAYDFIEKPFSKERIDYLVKHLLDCNTVETVENKKNEIIACSPSMQELLEKAKAVALTKACVLLQGESGTGKELIANFIHKESPRSKGNFLAINCASLPENLLESELFGHEKGAFTGAVSKRRGIFERADKGTLLLDEIGEITMSLQSKLLRVLQEYKFERVGGESSVSVDVRIIASTNRNLFNEIKNKHFREDLYYRLNVVPLFIPPLRERKEEIPLLSSHFIRKYCKMYNLEIEGISEEALKALMKYQWPGNVRELENCLERASILKRIGKIECNDLSFLEREKCMNSEENISIPKEAAPPLSNFIPEFSGMDVHDLEKEYIFETLKKFNGNRTHTAKALGISVRTIRNRIREYRTMGFAM